MLRGFVAAGGAASAWDPATGETAARVCSRMAGPAAWPHRGGGHARVTRRRWWSRRWLATSRRWHRAGGWGPASAGSARQRSAGHGPGPKAPPPCCTWPSSVPRLVSHCLLPVGRPRPAPSFCD
ncbi:hypothetical protein BS78_10G150200 [Paspalum vaginatum]|nr:hypothetical protein BS78_10G150200 [Paspalum vaginatum]